MLQRPLSTAPILGLALLLVLPPTHATSSHAHLLSWSSPADYDLDGYLLYIREEG